MRLFDIISTRFDNFDNTVRSYLQKAMSSIGVNYKSSQVFGLLLNAIKGVMQNAMFYIEDAFTEQNIFTAVRKKSVFNLAKISGYTPFYGQAAAGVVTISAINGAVYQSGSGSSSTRIYISDGAQLRDTSTGLVYTIMSPVDDYVIDLSKPSAAHEFKIVEGSYSYAQFTASGILFETFDVGVSGLWDSGYVEVTVNGEKYDILRSLYDAGPEDNACVVTNGYDSLFSVCFGDGTYGKRLAEGDTVRVKYLKHNGSAGNVSDDNVKSGRFIFDTMLNDSAGNYADGSKYLIIDVTSPITGGTDADTISEVRAGVGVSDSGAYVTPASFRLFLKRFSFIGWCDVMTEPGSLAVTALCMKNTDNIITNTLDYYNISDSDMLLTDYEKTMVQTAMENSGKMFAGGSFSVADPVIRHFAAVCYVKPSSSVTDRKSVTERVRTVFADYFMSIKQSTLFISKSDIISKIMSSCSDAITAFDFDFISAVNESAYKNGYYIKYKETADGSYAPVQCPYEPDNTALMDSFGNIQMDAPIETAVLRGGFKYYADKTGDAASRSDSVTITDAVQVYYI